MRRWGVLKRSGSARILLISAAVNEREMYAASLRRQGFCTLQASTAVDALKLASEVPPLAVVADERVPLEDAAHMLGVPIIVLTTREHLDRRARVDTAPALFLVKPCRPDTLSSAVIGLIRSGDHRDRVASHERADGHS